MQVRKGVILAAGKGTRLKELTRNRPKPMVEINGRPILQYVFDALKGTGIREFLVVTGYYAEMIEQHFGDGSQMGYKLHYVRQTVQNGTATATLLGKDFVGDEPFLLTFGDIITLPDNYTAFVNTYNNVPVDGQLAVYWKEDLSAGAAVYLDDNMWVTDIIEKPPPGQSMSHWMNAGLFIFKPLIFDYLSKVPLSVRGEYELTDAIRMMLKDGHPIRAYELKDFWSDLGTPQALEVFKKMLSVRAFRVQ